MIEILRAGIQTTVQDLGRCGHRHLGIAQSGALDAPAMQLANRLVGNAATLAGLEITRSAVEIRFHRPTIFALCGADFFASLDGVMISPAWRNRCAAGQVLKIPEPISDASTMRTYLAVDGGIAVPEFLGSRATDLQGKFGGFEGRALKKGDRLPLGLANHGEQHARRFGTLQPLWTSEIRVLPGPEYAQFSTVACDKFWNQPWTVSSVSNRMGYRLRGPVLARETGGDLRSHAVLPGVIQVPPNGQPIVLLADAQTTGGYPRIGVVIAADLWKAAQAPPDTQLRFRQIDLAGARLASAKWAQARAIFEQSAYGKSYAEK